MYFRFYCGTLIPSNKGLSKNTPSVKGSWLSIADKRGRILKFFENDGVSAQSRVAEAVRTFYEQG